MAATLFDMSKIALDPVFVGRVQAAVFQYAVTTIGGEGASALQHAARKNYAFDVLNNPAAYIQNFAWAAAANAILANDVITAAGANFTTATTAAAIAAAITTATPTTTGATDTDINNAVANAWNVMANCEA